MNNPRDELIEEIAAFLKESGMPPSTFGQNAIGDRGLLWRLREGRDLKTATIMRIREYIKGQRGKRHPKKAA